MSERAHTILFAMGLLVLGGIALVSLLRGDNQAAGYALACIVALFVRPPRIPQAPEVPGAPIMLLALLLLDGCKVTADVRPFGFRASSIEMTPQASNPVPAAVGGMYTKSSDGIPRLVDTSSNEYRAGDAKHVVISAGIPGGAVLGDCWIDSTDSHRLYCKEDAGELPQRTDLNSPGPIGGGTPDAAHFSSVTIGGAPVDAIWSRTCTITSAAAATPVTCLSDADVPPSKSAYLLGWHAKVNGATAWMTTASCALKDTSGLATPFVTVAVAAMTGNAFIGDHSANVTQNDAYALNLGTAADRGLVLVCNANGSGSDFVVTLFGVTK